MKFEQFIIFIFYYIIFIIINNLLFCDSSNPLNLLDFSLHFILL